MIAKASRPAKDSHRMRWQVFAKREVFVKRQVFAITGRPQVRHAQYAAYGGQASRTAPTEAMADTQGPSACGRGSLMALR